MNDINDYQEAIEAKDLMHKWCPEYTSELTDSELNQFFIDTIYLELNE